MKRYIKSADDVIVQQYINHLYNDASIQELENFLGYEISVYDTFGDTLDDEISSKLNHMSDKRLTEYALNWHNGKRSSYLFKNKPHDNVEDGINYTEDYY